MTQRYHPWGTVRSGSGNALPTGYTFTGQLDTGVGLMYYGARLYDAALARFIQPDTIVPQPGNPQTLSTNARITARGIRAFVAPFVDGRSDTIVPQPGNPQALNRYSYVLNNPVRYTDPTGMFEQAAIEEYLQSLDPDNWQDILSQWIADDQWWTALLAAQAGDILTVLDPEGNMRFARFEGEGKTKLSGLTLVDDAFGNDTLGTTELDEVYGGSLGLPAAVIMFNQHGQMDSAYGLNGFRANVSTVSKASADFHAFVFGIGLTSLYAYIPTATALQWMTKAVGTSAAGATVVPAARCYLGLCEGDQWLTVSMSAWSAGSENVLPHYYWKYYGEVRYHEGKLGFYQIIANW